MGYVDPYAQMGVVDPYAQIGVMDPYAQFGVPAQDVYSTWAASQPAYDPVSGATYQYNDLGVNYQPEVMTAPVMVAPDMAGLPAQQLQPMQQPVQQLQQGYGQPPPQQQEVAQPPPQQQEVAQPEQQEQQQEQFVEEQLPIQEDEQAQGQIPVVEEKKKSIPYKTIAGAALAGAVPLIYSVGK